MSQDARPLEPMRDAVDTETTVETIPPSVSPAVFSVQTYADRLMDELFEDVDHILVNGVALPPEPERPEGSLEASAIAKLVMPLLQRQPSEITFQSAIAQVELEQALSDDVSDLGLESALEPLLADDEDLDESEVQPVRGGLVDRLLLVLTAISVVITVAVGFMVQQRWHLASSTASAPSVPVNPNAEFLSYLNRALDNIDRRNASNPPIASAANPSDLPTVSVPGTTEDSNAPASSTVLERVYVPVYQPPQVVYPPATAPLAPAPAVVPSPGGTSSSALPLVAAASTPSAPSVTYTLVGVLELGDRSAALFEIDGVTQRIQAGESIGSSGWSLVSIANQEAVIRRNGEVRSIYVGQQF